MASASRAKKKRAATITATKRVTTATTISGKQAQPANASKTPVAVADRTNSSSAAMGATTADAAPEKDVKPNRMGRFLDSIQSVQEQPPKGKPRSRAYKIGLWAVMLMPVYAIIIYVVGFFVLLPATVQNVGVAKTLPAHVKSTVNGIAAPDHNGVFLQTSSDPKQDVAELQQYNDRNLQPPRDQQPILTPTGIHYLLIQDAQVSDVSDYKVFLIGQGSDKLITVHAERVPVPRIAEIAISMPNGAAWAPGSYMLDYLVAGMAPEDQYCFFTISATGK